MLELIARDAAQLRRFLPRSLQHLLVDETLRDLSKLLTLPRFTGAITELAPELLPRMVFCSGGAFTPRAQEFLASVPNLLLRKPLRRAELEGAIERLMACRIHQLP